MNTDKTLELRGYQHECVDLINNSEATRKSIVIPTGGGKTVIFASYARKHNLKTLVLAHRQELIQQTKNTFLNLDPSCDVGIVMGQQNETNTQITIASVQTLARRSRLHQLPTDYDLIICDEAHHSTADSYRRLFYRYGLIDLFTCGVSNAEEIEPNHHPDRTLLGVTATPERTDGESLDKIYDEVVYRLSIADLIPDYLSDFRCETHDAGVDISHVRSSVGDLNKNQLGEAMSEGGLLDNLPHVIADRLNDRKHILIFLPNVASATEATNILNDAGIPSGCVLGSTPTEQRRQTLHDFENGKLRVLVNCMVLTEGFDCPCIDALVVARPTKSGLLIQQMVGRGLRKAPGKQDCLILDLAFKRRQSDLISVAASGIFGGYANLHFTRPDLSILELIEWQKARAPHLQALHSVLSQRLESVKVDAKQSLIAEKEAEYDILPDDIDAESLSEGLLLLVDTKLLRRICGEAHDFQAVWKRLMQALSRTSFSMRSRQATHKQKKLLSDKFDFEFAELDLLNCADASALISTLIDFEPPTPKQLGWLRWRGVSQEDTPTTKKAASEKIKKMSAQRRKELRPSR